MHKTLAVFLLLASGGSAWQDASGELRKVLADQESAWNRGDLEGFMRGYSNSPELTYFSGDTITQGWQAILQRYRKKYQEEGKQMGQLSFSDEKIELLGRDAAMVTARWHLSMADGQKLEGLTTVICRLSRDGWKIVHDHSS